MAKLSDWKCPVCGRGIPVTFDLGIEPPEQPAKPGHVGTLTVYVHRAPLYAHLLTHGTYDGEPLPQAA